jgi:tRNA uridine 5-carbamoylmethylation protein Kti12
MSFNLNKVGRPLVKINGGKLDGKIVYLNSDDKDETIKNFSELKLPSESTFQAVPTDSVNDYRVQYVTGQSGSGKSYYVGNFLKEYKKKFPKNQMYLFSAVDDDKSLDKYKVGRINLNDEFARDPPKLTDFKNSLVIFDDTDVIKDKRIRDTVYALMNLMLETGRHHNISVVLTNHLATNGKDTKRILNECHSMTLFMKSGSGKGIKYLLTEYLGLDKAQIKKLKKMETRATTIFKTYPMVGVGEREIFLLKDVE